MNALTDLNPKDENAALTTEDLLVMYLDGQTDEAQTDQVLMLLAEKPEAAEQLAQLSMDRVFIKQILAERQEGQRMESDPIEKGTLSLLDELELDDVAERAERKGKRKSWAVAAVAAMVFLALTVFVATNPFDGEKTLTDLSKSMKDDNASLAAAANGSHLKTPESDLAETDKVAHTTRSPLDDQNVVLQFKFKVEQLGKNIVSVSFDGKEAALEGELITHQVPVKDLSKGKKTFTVVTTNKSGQSKKMLVTVERS